MTEDFSKLESRVLIEYTIETLSDLHIGARESTDPTSIDNPVLKDPSGRPIIPGSSIKGVFRSEIERLLKSFFDDEPIKCHNLAVELFGGDKKEVSEGDKNNESDRNDGNEMKKSYASSIKIHDAVAETTKTRIRDGVSIDRRTRKAEEGRKYDIEVVPKGTMFKGTIIIENPKLGDQEYAKLGAFLATVRFFNATNRSLGGGTSRGYGEVKFSITDMREYKPDDYIDGNIDGKPLELERENEFIEDWKKYIKSVHGG